MGRASTRDPVQFVFDRTRDHKILSFSHLGQLLQNKTFFFQFVQCGLYQWNSDFQGYFSSKNNMTSWTENNLLVNQNRPDQSGHTILADFLVYFRGPF